MTYESNIYVTKGDEKGYFKKSVLAQIENLFIEIKNTLY
jgi:hypothetical protein